MSFIICTVLHIRAAQGNSVSGIFSVARERGWTISTKFKLETSWKETIWETYGVNVNAVLKQSFGENVWT
jgi:hypothetical protein